MRIAGIVALIFLMGWVDQTCPTKAANGDSPFQFSDGTSFGHSFGSTVFRF